MNKEQCPDGKINENDLGRVGTAIYIENGHLIMNFGKNLSWVGLDKKEVKDLIDVLTLKLEVL